MAYYYGVARSNWFKVKDEARFREWTGSIEAGVREKEINGEKHFGVCDETPGCFCWPSEVYDQEADEMIEMDFAEELAKHLQDGSVAVLMEVGTDGLCALGGIATAINSNGEKVTIDIQDIYKAAERLGSEINELPF